MARRGTSAVASRQSKFRARITRGSRRDETSHSKCHRCRIARSGPGAGVRPGTGVLRTDQSGLGSAWRGAIHRSRPRQSVGHVILGDQSDLGFRQRPRAVYLVQRCRGETGPGRDHPAAAWLAGGNHSHTDRSGQCIGLLTQQSLVVRTSSSRRRMARSPPGVSALRLWWLSTILRRRSTRALPSSAVAWVRASTPPTSARARSTCSTAVSGRYCPAHFMIPTCLPASRRSAFRMSAVILSSLTPKWVRPGTMSRVPVTALSMCTMQMASCSNGWCPTVHSTRPGALHWPLATSASSAAIS